MAAGKKYSNYFVAYAKLVDAAQQQITVAAKLVRVLWLITLVEVTLFQALSQNELEAMRSSQAYGRQEFVATGRVDIPLQFSMSWRRNHRLLFV